jgi:hypothetical protein
MSTTSLVRIRILIVPASFEKRQKVLHTKLQVLDLVSAKGSPRKLSLFLLELQGWVDLGQYTRHNQRQTYREYPIFYGIWYLQLIYVHITSLSISMGAIKRLILPKDLAMEIVIGRYIPQEQGSTTCQPG